VRILLGGNSYDIGKSQQAAESILIVDDEKFVNPNMFRKKTISYLNWIGSNLSLAQSDEILAGRHRTADGKVSVAFFDDFSGEQTEKFSFLVNNRKGAEGVRFFGDQIENVADMPIRRN